MKTVAVEYLKGASGRWKSHLAADTNLRIYKVLFEHDPEEGIRYTEEILYWQTVKLHRDHLRHFPALIANGKFFMIFADYYRSMEFWGLRTELPQEELRRRMRVRPEERRKQARQWKQQGGLIRPPISHERGHSVVSSEFLRIGSYIFEPPNDQDPAFAGDQLLFNKAAERAMPELLDIVVALPRLPKSIAELLQRYGKRLYHRVSQVSQT